MKNDQLTPSAFAISSLISSLHPHWNYSVNTLPVLTVEMLPLSSINYTSVTLNVLQEDVINTQCGYDVRAKLVSLARSLMTFHTPSISLMQNEGSVSSLHL